MHLLFRTKVWPQLQDSYRGIALVFPAKCGHFSPQQVPSRDVVTHDRKVIASVAPLPDPQYYGI